MLTFDNYRPTLLSLLLVFCAACVTQADQMIVKDGKALAQIVITENPPRMTQQAADQLQHYIAKITGATLPITSTPTDEVTVKLYVGQSRFTDSLGINTDELKHGAFRIISGENYLVLIGKDRDFVPPEPYAYNHMSIPDMLQEWDKLSGGKWGNPYASIYRSHDRKTGQWEYDEAGSVNAVCEYLRSLGVRWYMPGELGEICPQTSSLALPTVDELVEPDFPLRFLYQYGMMWGMGSEDERLWQQHMGLSHAQDIYGLAIPGHGINDVHNREGVKEANPEYFRMYNGKRLIEKRHPSQCLSSEKLFNENVALARAFFDIYDAPLISVMPADGFSGCQCDKCITKLNLELGNTASLSNYVWDYVNRVAIELYKTHPDKKILCYAYVNYTQPPTNIESFSPNVVIGICQGRSWFYDQDRKDRFAKLRTDWLAKVSTKKFFAYEYYIHNSPRKGPMPALFPHLIAEDLKSMKGISYGDMVEVYRKRGETASLALNHLNIYVTSRYYWDVDQDIDAMLDEYYTLYYGPAAKEMKAFYQFVEARWMSIRKNAADLEQFFVLLDQGKAAAGEDTIYAKRIDLIYAFYEEPLRESLAKAKIGRTQNPKLTIPVGDASQIKLDGHFDDAFWKDVPSQELKVLSTGGVPSIPTTFQAATTPEALYFAIRCSDPDMATLNVASAKHDDMNIWSGDAVELLLETQAYSYYQIAISPSGAVTDLDRIDGNMDSLWSSNVQVAASRDDEGWSLEIKLPLYDELQRTVGPETGVAGDMPTAKKPWHFNVCRQRMREDSEYYSAFSPTGAMHFHDTMKFAELSSEK